MNEDEKKVRISNVEGGFMVAVALLFDAISLIPFFGTIVALVFGVGTFALWFYFRDVGFVSPKKIAAWGINGIAEAIPAVGSVWIGFTFGVIIMLVIVRTEDKTGISIPLSPKKSVTKNVGRVIGSPSRFGKGRITYGERLGEREAA